MIKIPGPFYVSMLAADKFSSNRAVFPQGVLLHAQIKDMEHSKKGSSLTSLVLERS